MIKPLFIFYSLFFVSTICINNKNEDIESDFMSGMMNGFYYTGESIANVGKDVTQFLGKSGDLLINEIKKYALFRQARMNAIYEVADREKKF